MQLHVKVPDDLKSFIDQTVATGSYSDAGAFLTNLLYNFKAQRESDLSTEQQAKLTALRAAVMIGVEQAERSDFVDFTADQIISEWGNRIATVS